MLTKLKNKKGKILLFLGIICLLYFVAITVFWGYLNVYNLVWVVIGGVCIAIYKWKEKILNSHKIIRFLFYLSVIAFVLSFIVIEFSIINNSKNKNTENAHYILLLGAGLINSEPSQTLFQRIDIAVKYLNENADVKVIASGGKDNRETYTEAEIMSKLLQDKGIEINRIIIEDRSLNTYENFKYSKNLIDIDKKVIIVSSDYHLFRAKSIAKKLGYKDIGIMANKTTPLWLLPNYYVREYFGILKEWLMSRM